MIELNKVSVIYDNKIKAIDDISLSLNHHCIGIIGENGSGKSTLLSSLVGLVEHKGDIKVEDKLVNEANIVDIRNHFGFVFQNPDSQLFMPTVKEDILFGLINQGIEEEKRNALVEEISGKFGLHDLLDRVSSKLSGGQKRMVSLASVLVMKPRVLLLDEPSSYLDPKSRRIIMNLMKELDEDIIFATHDLDMAYDLCDEVVLINNGKIIKTGDPKVILKDKALLEANGLELPFKFQGE